jgi:hypothetical protein
MVNYKKRRVTSEQDYNSKNGNIVNSIEELARLPYYSHYHKFNLFNYGDRIKKVHENDDFAIINFVYSLVHFYNILKLDGPTKVRMVKPEKHKNYKLFGVSYLEVSGTGREDTSTVIFHDYFTGVKDNVTNEDLLNAKKSIHNYKLKKRLRKNNNHLK